MKRLNIAMLSEDQVKTIEEPVQSNLDVLGSQVEDHLSLATDAQSEIDGMGAAVNDADEVVDELIIEGQAAQDAMELPDKARQVAVESIQRNVSNILKTIGLGKQNGFAMESINSNSSIALETTMQDIKEFIKKIWTKIKEVWNRIIDAISKFFKNIFSAASQLKKRAEKIKKLSSELKGKKIDGDVKYEAPSSVRNYMRLGYKAIPAATLDKGLSGQNKLNTYLINSLTDDKAMRRYESAIDDVVKSTISDIENPIAADREEFLKHINKFLEPVLVHFTQKKNDVLATNAFISDRVITLHNFKIGVTEVDGFEEIKGQHEVLEPFQIEKICSIVIDQMNNYDKIDNKIDVFKSFIKEINKVEVELTKQSSKSENWVIVKTRTNVASNVVNNIMSIAKNAATQIRVLDIQINKAAIDWCGSSLKMYK